MPHILAGLEIMLPDVYANPMESCEGWVQHG